MSGIAYGAECNLIMFILAESSSKNIRSTVDNNATNSIQSNRSGNRVRGYRHDLNWPSIRCNWRRIIRKLRYAVIRWGSEGQGVNDF